MYFSYLNLKLAFDRHPFIIAVIDTIEPQKERFTEV